MAYSGYTLPGKGTTYKWPVSATPTIVHNVESIKPHNGTVPAVRFMAVDDADDTVVGGGIHKANQITIRMAYDPTSAVHLAMYADFIAGTVRASTITYADTGGCTIAYGESLISAWDKQEINSEGLQMVALTIDVSSVTITP